MAGTVKKQKYDLEERTKGFAIDVRRFLKRLPVSISNKEDARQLVKPAVQSEPTILRPMSL